MRLHGIAKQLNISRFDSLARSKEIVPDFDRSRRCWMTLLVTSFMVAVATGISGIAIAVVSLVQLLPLRNSSSISSFLIATTFAASLFAAHCLDRIDAVDHARNVAELKEKLKQHRDNL